MRDFPALVGFFLLGWPPPPLAGPGRWMVCSKVYPIAHLCGVCPVSVIFSIVRRVLVTGVLDLSLFTTGRTSASPSNLRTPQF